MPKKYQDLIEKGLLKTEKIGFGSVRKVLTKAGNDLKSAKILLKSGQFENAYELAYEAMLSAGRALAFAFDLRPRSQGSHKIVIDFSERILKRKIIIVRFEKMRKKRHYLIYGAGLAISEKETRGAIGVAEEFIDEVAKIVKSKDPQKELRLRIR